MDANAAMAAIDNEIHDLEQNEENESTDNVAVDEEHPTGGENTQGDLMFQTPVATKRKVLASLKRPNSRGSTIKEKSSKISETTGRQKWHQKGPTLEEAQIIFFKSAEKVFKKDEEPIVTANKENKENVSSDGNNHFAKFIAAELDQLPKKIQRIARYEITNALYNVQAEPINTRRMFRPDSDLINCMFKAQLINNSTFIVSNNIPSISDTRILSNNKVILLTCSQIYVWMVLILHPIHDAFTFPTSHSAPGNDRPTIYSAAAVRFQ